MHAKSSSATEHLAVLNARDTTDGKPDVVSDSLATVSIFGRGRAWAVRSLSRFAGFWREIYNISSDPFTLRHTKAHRSIDTAQCDEERFDIRANSGADHFADVGAGLHLPPDGDVTVVNKTRARWTKVLGGMVQCLDEWPRPRVFFGKLARVCQDRVLRIANITRPNPSPPFAPVGGEQVGVQQVP